MLEANELNSNVAEDNLTMSVDEEDKEIDINRTADGEKILKGLTMEVNKCVAF